MEETEEMRIKRIEEEEQEKRNDKERWENEKEDNERRINEMTDRQINEIIFDSEIHDWNVNDSDFSEELRGKKDIIILIEDERQNLFGGYIGNEIRVNENVKDDSSYVFSLRKNGEYTMKRYLRNEIGDSYWIINSSHPCLIGFGADSGRTRDITLSTKDYSTGLCQQKCYNYNGELYALAGKRDFNIKRIVVYQLGEKEGIFSRIKNMFS